MELAQDRVCCHHHRHYHVSLKDSGHMLTRSGLTHPEVSSVAFIGYFCLLGCSFLINLGNLLRDIRSTCCVRPAFSCESCQ
jgi:hypothetical protein